MLSSSNDCTVKPYPMTECIYKLQCRRRCDNSYPVPNAHTVCPGSTDTTTGKFEGDRCIVQCKQGFTLAGSRYVYCKKGVWSNRDGTTATSRCDQDHKVVHKETNDVVREIIKNIPVGPFGGFGGFFG